jgi:hypothetical protein
MEKERRKAGRKMRKGGWKEDEEGRKEYRRLGRKTKTREED